MTTEPQSDPQDLAAELDACKNENRAKSEFLSMVTHQLRTPLSGIKWTFKMLLDGDLGSFTDEQRAIIQKGYESNERMIKLLEEVIVANHTNSWDFQYSRTPSDIEHIIGNIVTEFLEEARVHKIHMVFNHPPRPLPLISVDPEKIAIVFQNLIENAIKYSEPEDTITITMNELDANHVEITVADTGLGIPDEAKPSIFTKFFRADNVKELQKNGTGLGLFTAKNIVEKHGGTIRFESAMDQGTTFFITLPVSTPTVDITNG